MITRPQALLTDFYAPHNTELYAVLDDGHIRVLPSSAVGKPFMGT
jgi:hypothetical protein